MPSENAGLRPSMRSSLLAARRRTTRMPRDLLDLLITARDQQTGGQIAAEEIRDRGEQARLRTD